MRKKVVVNDKDRLTIYYFDQVDAAVASNVLCIGFRRSLNCTDITATGSKIDVYTDHVDHYMNQSACEIYADKLRNEDIPQDKQIDVKLKDKNVYGIIDGIPREVAFLNYDAVNIMKEDMILKFPEDMEIDNKIRYAVLAYINKVRPNDIYAF